jgi:hypothetical protein
LMLDVDVLFLKNHWFSIWFVAITGE